MYVCVCKAVTDKQIYAAAKAGAKTLKDLRQELNVATECGRCASCAKACLKSAHQEIKLDHQTSRRPINLVCVA